MKKERVVAVILAGGVGKRLSLLTRYRAKPAVPFAGRYRIIDFTLTNCIRSGIDEVYVLTQYIARSLVKHIGVGKPWDLDRLKGGMRVLHPHLGYRAVDWYRGTADALYQNRSLIRRLEADRILILSGDHVYRMDYRELLDFHAQSGKPACLGVVKVPKRLTAEFGIATVDNEGNITKFEEKPAKSDGRLASMGIYIFDKKFLLSLLKLLEAKHNDLDFGKHVVPYLVGRREIAAFHFKGYWLDIGTVKSYYRASLELLSEKSRLRLDSRNGPVLTVPDDSPPTVIAESGSVENSLVCNGCIISGFVSNSILSPGVRIDKGATVNNSIIFDDCVIESGAILENVIVDKAVRIGKGAIVGLGNPKIPNNLQPGYLDSGITLIGKRTIVPSNVKIGTNCLVSGPRGGGAIPKKDIEDGGSYLEEGGA